MQQNVVTIRLDSELQHHLDTLATALDRPRSWVISQACQEFVEINQWQIEAIKEGIASLDKGQFIPHETLMRRLEDRVGKEGEPPILDAG